MKWYKIKALMWRDLMVIKRSKWRALQLFYFPVTSVIIWGLFAIFSQQFALEAGLIVLAINIFWSFSLQSQSGINNMMNEDVWSGSIKQIMTTGISELEYIFSRIILSIITSFVILLVLLGMSVFWFNLSVVAANPAITFYFAVSSLVASIGLAILIAAVFIYLGREYVFLAWTALQLFILLSAPFYPVEIFPEPIRTISYAMPYTGTFIGIREFVTTGSASGAAVLNSFIVPIVYLIISIPLLKISFRRAKRTGILVNID
ncbi:MAG: ABC transporter permease [Candidatus Aenigmarchaeota archaeon]|nr:ABC transporter permease [Candidatus Aenigmarchaeota archaeon]